MSGKMVSYKSSKEILKKLLSSPRLEVNLKDRQNYLKIHYLITTNLITLKEVDGITTISLTKEGDNKALRYSLQDLKINKPLKWDKKWRIVTFDIPEKHKLARRVLKSKLDELGFKQYQKSVYIHPFECKDEVEFLRVIYGIRPYVKIVVAENIDDENKFLRLYHLSKK